jgi:hypothetical protein
MNELPREARWSLAVALTLGLLLAGFGAGVVVGGGGMSATGPTKVSAESSSDALRVDQSGEGTGVRSATDGGTAGYFASQGGNSVVAITAAGSSSGVYAQNDGSQSGGAAVFARGRQNNGVVATSDSASSAAIRGLNSAPDGVAIWGSTSGTGVGVFGVSQGADDGQNPAVGLAGESSGTGGIGVFGMNLTGGNAGYFNGGVTVTRDLWVGGAVLGYSGVLAINVSSHTIKAGDAVTALGVQHGPNGIYLIEIVPAAKGQSVLGVADCAASFQLTKAPSALQDSLGNWRAATYDANVVIHGSSVIYPGSKALVATSPAGASPATGTVVGRALAAASKGPAVIPILIQVR